jgi:hypothetical protein
MALCGSRFVLLAGHHGPAFSRRADTGNHRSKAPASPPFSPRIRRLRHAAIFSARVLLDCTKQICRARMGLLLQDVTMREPAGKGFASCNGACQ